MAERSQRSMVRYIFGSYEPYREATGRASADHADHDRSYAPFDYVDVAYQDGYDDAYDEFYGSLPVEDRDPDLVPVAYDDVPFDEFDDVYEDDHHGIGTDPVVPRVSADVPADHLETDRSRPRQGARRAPGPAPVRRFPTPVSNVAAGGGGGQRRRNGGRSADRTALHRRRRIFLTLVTSVMTTLGGVVALRSPEAWIAHGVAVVLLAGYIVLLVVHHQRLEEKTTKVRELSVDDGRSGVRTVPDIGYGAEVAR